MVRRVCGIVAILIAVASTYTDVLACGDKFLRVGRSARFRHYNSVHPSAILVYAPRWTRRGISDFERMLKHGGHRQVLTVTTVDALSQAFATTKYDMVITKYGDVRGIKAQLVSMPSKPALLPIVYNETKTIESEASATYRCMLKPEKMTTFQALEEIDRLLDLRLKDSANSAAMRIAQ